MEAHRGLALARRQHHRDRLNKSESLKELNNRAKERGLTEKENKELTAEEKEYKSKRKLVREKLITPSDFEWRLARTWI